MSLSAVQSHARRYLLPLATSFRLGFCQRRPVEIETLQTAAAARCASPHAASTSPLTASSFRTDPPYSLRGCCILLRSRCNQVDSGEDAAVHHSCGVLCGCRHGCSASAKGRPCGMTATGSWKLVTSIVVRRRNSISTLRRPILAGPAPVVHCSVPARNNLLLSAGHLRQPVPKLPELATYAQRTYSWDDLRRNRARRNQHRVTAIVAPTT